MSCSRPWPSAGWPSPPRAPPSAAATCSTRTPAARPRGSPASASLGPHLARADALATAAFAMGRDAEAWLATVPGHWAYGLDASGRGWFTGDWAESSCAAMPLITTSTA